jgi:hypothetical protein
MMCTATEVPKAFTFGAIVVQIIGFSDWHCVPLIGSRHEFHGQLRCLFLSSLMTVVGLTCNTRAVSRIPLAFMATSTICSLLWRD